MTPLSTLDPPAAYGDLPQGPTRDSVFIHIGRLQGECALLRKELDDVHELRRKLETQTAIITDLETRLEELESAQ